MTQMSIVIQDITGNEDTSLIDMYVDTFLTTGAFDMDKSFDFIHKDRTIYTGETDITKDTYEEFQLGISAGTDYTTLSNRVVLANTNGGSEGNKFSLAKSLTMRRPKPQATGTIVLANRSRILLTAEKVEMGRVYLHIKQQHVHPDRTVTENQMDYLDFDGDISNIAHAVHGEEAHIVFTHKNDAGQTAIYYFSATSTEVSLPKQVTEYVDYADNATVVIDKDMLVIAFDSERIQSGVRNIEYVTKKDLWSGIIHVTSDTTHDSKNPSVLLHDKQIHIAYDSFLVDNVNENIRLTKIDQSGAMTHQNITSLGFANVKPQMTAGTDDIIRIAWLSNRLSDNKGVDFVFIYSNGDISGTRTVMSPTSSMYCTDVRIAIDYQNITHVIFVSNEQNTSITNIVYSYVTENNVVTEYGNIIKDDVYSVVSPSITLNGDELIVSGNTNSKFYQTFKSLANYLASGYYTIEFDGLSPDTKWLGFTKIDYIPAGAGITYQVRVSNDKYLWTDWKDASLVTRDKLSGQYLQMRAHMTSAYHSTPEIHELRMRCEPNMVRIQTVPRKIDKDIQNCIVMADYEGDIKFFVSRDGGDSFIETMLDRTTNLLGTATTQNLVLRAEIQKGSLLKSWALIW